MITILYVLGFVYIGLITYVLLAIWGNSIDILDILDPDHKVE